MAHASRKIRKTRRLKRERTIAVKMAELALNQRDQARIIAYALEKELKKREQVNNDPNNFYPPDDPTDQAAPNPKPKSFEIVRLNEEGDPIEFSETSINKGQSSPGPGTLVGNPLGQIPGDLIDK